VNLLGRLVVRALLLVGPDGLEALDEVGAGDDRRARGADQLERAGVDARDVRDVVHGRVLHGDGHLARGLAAPAGVAGDGLADGRVKLLPAPVDDLAAGQRVELETLDGVDDADRLARGGHVVEPAARGEAAVAEAEDAVGERVRAAEVVEEPAVEPRLAERRLNLRDARGRGRVDRLRRLLRARRENVEAEKQEKEGGARG
jgi:predicted RecA/RadA family phage recombinase